MELYEAINKRRTIRDFENNNIDTNTIQKIISAGINAPTNDHMRDWHFVVLTDKEIIRKLISEIPKTASQKHVDFIMKSWKTTDEYQLEMYANAIPKQYQMLMDASCAVLPFFRQNSDLLSPKSLSSLNAFASIWCCIENMLLAATAENYSCSLRIPSGDEFQHVKEVLELPEKYVMPCYIGIGKPKENVERIRQKEIEIGDKIHYNAW